MPIRRDAADPSLVIPELDTRRRESYVGRMSRHLHSSPSAQDELRIAVLSVGRLGGAIGITFTPGKKQTGGLTGDHDRDLAADLDVIAKWGAAAVVTLMEADELERYLIPHIGVEVRARFMEWHHLPIRDYDVPGPVFEAAWPDRSRRLRALVAAGNRILVHCRGGLGRAGMVGARLLVEMGIDPDEAIRTVRRERDRRAIETAVQEAWVRRGKPGEDVLPRDRHARRSLGPGG